MSATIRNTYHHIVITHDGSVVRMIPKSSVVIYRATKHTVGGTKEKVYLNWPAGDNPGARDTLEITYDEVSSPTVTSNAELELLLQSYTGTPTYILTDTTQLHRLDFYAIVGNQQAVLGYVYENGVEREDLTTLTLEVGIPIFPGTAGGLFTHIKLNSGSVALCIAGGYEPPYTTSTTTTTT